MRTFLKHFFPTVMASMVSFLVAISGSFAVDGQLTEVNFCARAQQVIAGTDLLAQVQNPADYDAFVQSKASDSPFVVQQLLSNPATDDPQLPRVLSCKMRTAERINALQGKNESSPVAAGDTSCAEVHRAMLSQVSAGIPVAEQVLAPGSLVIEEEDTTYMGPMWLKPWPFEPVLRGQDGKIHIHSRALYVPHAWWIPMPERFQGNYYCHLISPQYLEALLRGQIQP